MKTELNENLGKTGATIFCKNVLETIAYENVSDDVWLASSSLGGSKKQMKTEAVLHSVERLREEGFKVRVCRAIQNYAIR